LNAPDKKKSILIIGVGNEYRNDDAIGIHIARKIKGMGFEGVVVKEQSGEGTSLMEIWKDHDHVFIVDAVSSGSAPGSIICLNASNESIPAKYFSCSTHNFGVAEAIEMARALDQLPERIELFGIEGKSFEPGEVVSREVKLAAESVTQDIIQSVSSTS